jgi:hypothetical protein
VQVHKTGKLAALGVALLCVAAPAVHAQEAALQAHGEISVPFMDGGIGQSEAASMRRAGRDFDLRMEFSSRKDNEFVAAANLLVTDMSGAPVLTLADAGPIVNVDLPAGRYRVAATWHGRTETRFVSLNGKAGQGGTDLYFHWQAGRKGDAPAATRAIADLG